MVYLYKQKYPQIPDSNIPEFGEVKMWIQIFLLELIL